MKFGIISRSLGKIAFNTTEYLVRGKILNKNKGSRYLKENEQKEILSPRNKGLLLDGKSKRLSVKNSLRNVEVDARIGKGKTTSYGIPNILSLAETENSIIVHDPKGEQRELTSGYLRAKGFNVVVFNPDKVSESNLFNPLIEAKTQIEIEQVAGTLVNISSPNPKDPYWNSGAITILSILLKCLSFGEEKYNNLPNLYYLLNSYGDRGDGGLNKWVSKNCWDSEYPNDDMLAREWNGVISGNEKVTQTFLSIAKVAIKSLGNRDLRMFFSKSDYKLSDIRKQKTVIYFITPAQNQKYFSFITSLFFNAVFKECMREEHRNNSRSLPVYVIYDEFGNSYIPDFVSVANTIRGYDVSLSIILQSRSQLEMRYGQKEAESIQGAFNTNICLSASDHVTAKYYSELIGKVKNEYIPSMNEATPGYREYNLLNPDEVRRIESDEAIIVTDNKHVIKTKVTPYYKNRKFKIASQFPIVHTEFRNRKYSLPLVELETE